MSGFYNAAANPAATAHVANALDVDRVIVPEELSARCVLANPRNRSVNRRVAIVSGGGSGHEPFAAGLVGPGLLDAAVAGDVFASPTAAAVADTLRSVAKYWRPHDTIREQYAPPAPLQGIVVLVLNYQGDRFSFSRAIADVTKPTLSPDGTTPQQITVPIEAVFIADDVSIPHATECRGLAGAAVVLKLAGAASEQGRSFGDVLHVAKTALQNIFTIGVALQPAHLPNQRTQDNPNSHQRAAVELGLGIHNEPGAERLSLSPETDSQFADNLLQTVCDRLLAAMFSRYPGIGEINVDKRFPPGVAMIPFACDLVFLVNNLGGVSQLAMGTLVSALADYAFGAAARRLWNSDERDKTKPPYRAKLRDLNILVSSGTLVSSLDMNGFSVTVLRVWDSSAHELFISPVSLPWPRPMLINRGVYDQVQSRTSNAVAKSDSSNQSSSSQHSRTLREDIEKLKNLSTEETVIVAVVRALESAGDELSALDAATGDGDFGDTIRSGCGQIMRECQDGCFDGKNGQRICADLARSTGTSMGGSFGNMTSTFWEGCCRGYDSGGWISAFCMGTDNVMSVGGAVVGDRTLVDALKPAADCLSDTQSVRLAAEAARRGADTTRDLTKAKFGRSSFVGASHLRGKHDPGALAVAVMLDAVATVIEP